MIETIDAHEISPASSQPRRTSPPSSPDHSRRQRSCHSHFTLGVHASRLFLASEALASRLLGSVRPLLPHTSHPPITTLSSP
eukprot:11551399-Heterocapsa_arctica.AAC.1